MMTMKKMSHAETQRRRVKDCKMQIANCKSQIVVSAVLLCVSASLREIFFFLLLLLPVISSQAENWDRFRGPNGAGQSDSSAIPSEWKPESFLWRQKLAGIGHSSPVIWEGRLFLISADGETGEQIIQAFDAVHGTPLWERRADAGAYKVHGFNSLASSTPAVDAHHLYVAWLADGRVKLGAWTHDGERVWERDIGSYQEQHGFGKSPVVVDGLVWVANDSEATSSIVALDALSGDLRRTVPRPSGVTSFASPCVLERNGRSKQLLAASTAAGLAGIDMETGETAWQLKDEMPLRCVGSPIAAGGLMITTCGEGGSGKVLVAAKPGDAEHDAEVVYRLEKDVPYVPTPIVAGDLLFLWHDRGTVSCHDVATGRQHWRQRVGGDFHSSPILVGDRILAASRGGEVVVLAAAPKFELLGRNMLDEPCVATPAAADDRLYIRTESTLLCIGKLAGSAE
jgi:outer membrane protein assembly factor BamB